MRFDYLQPAIDAVVEGLEDHEKIEQGQYQPLRTLPGEGGASAIYRMELSFDQRRMVAEGADVLVEILHFGGPLAPTRVMILNQQNMDDGDRQRMKRWFAAQTKGPYIAKLSSEEAE